MIDESLIHQLNQGYVCPPGAPDAWREASEFGFDMSLIEETLKQTVEERLEAHQRMLEMIFETQQAAITHVAE